jgi:stage V sporulation protein G
MEITEIRVFPVGEERLKAYVTITFDNCFLIRDLKIVLGNKGLYVAMPSKKRKDGTYQDVVHPLNSDMRKIIEDKVFAEYNRKIAMLEQTV